MSPQAPYSADTEAILSHIHGNGGGLWTTPDRRLLKGGPFSTVECVRYLLELGMDPGAWPAPSGTFWTPSAPTGAGAARSTASAGALRPSTPPHTPP